MRINKNLFVYTLILSSLIPLVSGVTGTQIMLRPNGAGTWQQWTCSSHSGSILSDNSHATYCNQTAVRRNETNAMGSLPANAFSINNVTERITAWSQGASGGENGAIVTVVGGTTYNSAAIGLTRNTPTNISNLRTTSPNTGIAYTVAEVNAMEIGMQPTTLGAGERMNVSETYAIVDYNADTTSPSVENPSTNATTISQNQFVNFTANWTDDELGLAGYIFSINQTGNFVNSSYVPFSGVSANSTNVSRITAVAGTTVEWYFFANDTGGNFGTTTKQTFVVAGADTCTYGGSGNWIINSADNCIFATAQSIGEKNNISITGTGILTFNSGGKWAFTGSEQYITIGSGTDIVIQNGGFLSG